MGLEFLGREVTEGWVEALGVVPADPLDDGVFDLVSVSPGALVLDQLGLEGAVEGFGHRVDAPMDVKLDRRHRGRDRPGSQQDPVPAALLEEVSAA
nr:hypothetical protein [Streptomyces agglomeratus]